MIINWNFIITYVTWLSVGVPVDSTTLKNILTHLIIKIIKKLLQAISCTLSPSGQDNVQIRITRTLEQRSYCSFVRLNHAFFPSFASWEKVAVEMNCFSWFFLKGYSYFFLFFSPELKTMYASLHKKWNFPLWIYSVNATKPAGNCGFGHIYWGNPYWKNLFFVQCVLLQSINILTLLSKLK